MTGESLIDRGSSPTSEEWPRAAQRRVGLGNTRYPIPTLTAIYLTIRDMQWSMEHRAKMAYDTERGIALCNDDENDSCRVGHNAMTIKLEDVFKVGGLPTHTFVRPVEYSGLIVALRTPGRGVVVEGPSGIGKTTSVTQALSELGLGDKVVSLTARKPADLEMVRELPEH